MRAGVFATVISLSAVGTAHADDVTTSIHLAQTTDGTAARPVTGEKADVESTLRRKPIELEEVVVTGTHLRTEKTASPVVVITAADLEKQGLTTADDIIRSMPQNFSDINAGSSLNNALAPGGAQGQSAADLRGLGSENTLILVNGRRRAASSTFGDGTVNLNTIPVSAIDRVEVITDGASAIYGSDAVAGVINFILKKDYRGGETHVRQDLGSNGGDTISVDQTGGFTWSSGNVTGGARYSRTNPIISTRAGLHTVDFTNLGGTDQRTSLLSGLGQPGVVNDFDGNTLGTLPANDNGTSGVAGKLAPANFVPFDPGKNPYDVGAKMDSFSLDFNAEQSLAERVRAYAEVSYAKNTAESVSAAPVAGAVVPTTNRYNDLGMPVIVGYGFGQEYRQGLIPGYTTESDQTALGGTLGFKIALPGGWSADLSANYQREKALAAALILDQVLLAERAAGVDAQGNPLPADQHLSLFGNGTAQNPAALAGLMSWNVPGVNLPGNISTTQSALLNAEGAVLTLPTGEIRLATGGEFRREGFKYSGIADDLGLLTASPSRNVKALYAETTVPIVGGNMQVPGVYSLDFFAAGRWEQYSITGPFAGSDAAESTKTFTRTSPKFGVSWYPLPELKLRATYSHAFRAPRLSDLFSVSAGPFVLWPVIDPQNPSAGLIFPNYYTMGNPALRPETSDNLTAGLDWKPSGALQGLSTTLTYDKVNFKDKIDDLSTIAAYTPDLLFTIPGVVQRDANGDISRINLGPTNLAEVRSESVDASVRYATQTRVGDLDFGLSGTYTLRLQQVTVPGAPVQVLSGTENGPEKVKATSWVGWSKSGYGLNLYTHYSGRYINDNNNSINVGPISVQTVPVASYTTFDLTGSYTAKAGWSVQAGARNLFDKAFPFLSGYRVPWDERRVDLRGRVIYLQIGMKY